LVLVAALLAAGCGGADADRRIGTGMTFVPAPPKVIAACHATARIVGYAVPCPTKVPQRTTETGVVGPTGCALHVIGPAVCAKSWRGWVVGSSYAGNHHLVLTASPTPLSNYAKVVNGPPWYPTARVRPVAWVTVDGQRMRAVFVPPETNDGSAFAHHVVLIWTVGEHTYAVGFHDVTSIRQTLLQDEELVRGIRLVDD
jgi:hypothetical protein